MIKALYFFQRKLKNLSGLERRPTHTIKFVKENEFLPELIVPVILAPEIPDRNCWKTFVEDFRLSAVVSQARKKFRK